MFEISCHVSMDKGIAKKGTLFSSHISGNPTISSVAAPHQVAHPYHTACTSLPIWPHAVNCSAMLGGTNTIRESIQEIIDYCK
jgi:hypothetical protein